MNDRGRPEAAHGAATEKHKAGSGFERSAPRRLDSRAEIEDWVAERWRVLSTLLEKERRANRGKREQRGFAKRAA
jgi:hypothetical protein